jgi:hypothetical protein
MWKSKITEWGLDKNNKKEDVLAILRKKAERDAAGKKTVFKLRGREVDFKDIERYATRNHISETTVGDLVASHPQTPPSLECLTPEPSPGTLISRPIRYVEETRFRRMKTCMVQGYQRNIRWQSGVASLHATVLSFPMRSSYNNFDVEAMPNNLQPAIYTARGLPRNKGQTDTLSCHCSECLFRKRWYKRPRFVASCFRVGTLNVLLKKEKFLPFPVVLR